MSIADGITTLGKNGIVDNSAKNVRRIAVKSPCSRCREAIQKSTEQIGPVKFHCARGLAK